LRSEYPHFIDGAPAAPSSGQWIDGNDPSTGERLTRCARGNEKDVDLAVRSAQSGFEAWRKLEPPQRSRILARIAAGIRGHSESLALLETLDTGKPLKIARFDVETCARYFEYFSGVADKMLGEVIPASNKHLVYTRREPYGVTGHIIPWNGPITQAGRGAAPALCAGNSVVLKPAEETPVTTFELARICVEAGLPPGALNVVNGYGPEAGAALVRHPLVRKVSFTGSVETGRSVLRTTADRIVPATVELGGKSPLIVFEDADIDRAAVVACRAFVFNSGQICSAGTRLLVARSVQSRFVDRLREAMAALRIGRGVDDFDLGPVVSRRQLDRVLGYIDIARSEGASVAHGGGSPAGLPGGYYVEPTLLCNATNDMRVAREEIFGPVGLVIPFDGDEDAVTIANDTEYGLASAIWTSDVGRAHHIAEQMQSGQVYVNDYQPIGPEAPFGGYKNSGFGREKGLASLHDYTQVKTIIVNKSVS
jgi:acyl-CoA reductase-like NAD-dependent aldehyde dehydrogenase